MEVEYFNITHFSGVFCGYPAIVTNLEHPGGKKSPMDSVACCW